MHLRNDPVQKFTHPWFLTLCCFLNDPHLCLFISLVIVFHESLVCPEQLNCLLFFRKILQLTLILWFCSILVYLNPFQLRLYDFEIHLSTLAAFPSTYFYAHFNISHKKSLDGNVKMRINSKMCIKNVSRINFLSGKMKLKSSGIETHLPNKLLHAHR